MTDWFLVSCDKPTCLANVGRPCMTNTGNTLPKMESHVARRRAFYAKYPDQIPPFHPLRRNLPMSSPNNEVMLSARVRELEAQVDKLRADVRLQALDRALEHHRRAWSTDERATADEIKTTTEAFEKIILGTASSGVTIENFPPGVCPECRGEAGTHADACLLGKTVRRAQEEVNLS